MIFKKVILLLSMCFLLNTYSQSEIYEWRVYEIGFFKQADLLHNYFEKALIPALNRQQISNIGVFEEIGEALPKKVYVLIGYPSLNSHQEVWRAVENDTQYKQDGKAYLAAEEDDMPYRSYSTSLIQSSTGFPNLKKPSDDNDYFELRIYGSHNEDALRRKLKMFNDHEFPIFEDAGLNMVFFGVNIAGDHMPCLTYLLATTEKAAHNAGWSKFIAHTEWQRITKLEEYKNAMNEIIRVFLKPLPYSQI